jgi:glycosyltransferase involved in cell wall biosynthesis
VESMANVAVVVAVHNDVQTIESVLVGLDRQRLAPAIVVVVDDGSTDETPVILASAKKKYGLAMKIVTLPKHDEDKAQGPGLSKVFDSGLEVLRRDSRLPDYVMKLDGDHFLPEDYLERIIRKMEEDERLVIARGWARGEMYVEHATAGSGMVIKTSFWNRLNGMRFPHVYSWESWVYFKALQYGFKTRCYGDIQSRLLRKTSTSRGILNGRMMFEAGYDWRYVMGKCMIMSLRSPKMGVQMLVGYTRPDGIRRLDLSAWMEQWQRNQIPKLFLHGLRNRLFQVPSEL